MATKGRDLKVSFLTDLDRFNTAPAADDLDALGAAAVDAGRDLDTLNRADASALDDVARGAKDAGTAVDRMGTDVKGVDLDTLERQAKAAGTAVDKMGTDVKGVDLDTLAKDAKATAARVDSAFDKIARSSKSNLSKVDDAADTAGEGVKEMGDEIKGEAIEGAASFDGSMDSIKDSAQSAAVMALQAFGPVGAGIGIAAAAGYGLFRAQAEKAKEAVTALAEQMIADGGRLSQSSILSKIQEFATDGSILDLKRQAEEARIPVSDYINALAGDSEALDRSNRAIRERQTVLAKSVEGQAEFTGETTAYAGALDDVSGKLAEQAEQAQTAQDAVDALNGVVKDGVEISEEVRAAIEAHGAALDAFVDPVSVYTALLADKNAKEQATAQATADATEDQKDSWEDYAKSVDVSVGEYLKSLERQVKAQEEWAGNLTTLAKRGVDDGVLAELERMGPEGAPLVAKLTHASDAELTKLVTLMGRQGAAAGQATAANIADQGPAVSRAAAGLRSRAAVALARTITVPVRLQDATPAARIAWGEADRYFRDHPITIRTKGPTGQRPIRDVP